MSQSKRRKRTKEAASDSLLTCVKRIKSDPLITKIQLLQLISRNPEDFLKKHISTTLSPKRALAKLEGFVEQYNKSSIDRDVAINLLSIILWYIFKHHTEKIESLFSIDMRNEKTLEAVEAISNMNMGGLINRMISVYPLINHVQNNKPLYLDTLQQYVSSVQYHNTKITTEDAVELLECVESSDPRACQQGQSCCYLVQCKHDSKFDPSKLPRNMDSKFNDNNMKCLLCERLDFRMKLQSGQKVFDSCYVEVGYPDTKFNMQYSQKYNLAKYDKTVIIQQHHLVKGQPLN